MQPRIAQVWWYLFKTEKHVPPPPGSDNVVYDTDNVLYGSNNVIYSEA